MILPLRHLCIITLLVLASCTTPRAPTRFYTLSAPMTAEAAPAQTSSPLFIEVMPVHVPERLARPQMVVRNGASDSQIRILEQDRWSSPFDYELHDAFAGAISSRLNAIDISRGGRPADARSYRIAVELLRFDAVPDGHLQAAFNWSIKRSDDGTTAVCQTAITQDLTGGIGGLVQGMQQAVSKVSTGISLGIAALEAGETVTCTGLAP